VAYTSLSLVEVCVNADDIWRNPIVFINFYLQKLNFCLFNATRAITAKFKSTARFSNFFQVTYPDSMVSVKPEFYKHDSVKILKFSIVPLSPCWKYPEKPL